MANDTDAIADLNQQIAVLDAAKRNFVGTVFERQPIIDRIAALYNERNRIARAAS